MPFHIQDVLAYRELVLDKLRKQATMQGTETFNLVQQNPGYWQDGNPKYDGVMVTKLDNAQNCYRSLDKVLWYCYCYMPQHFDAFQRVIQMEEESTFDVEHGDAFRKRVFNTDGDLLVIDMGCGPMTAGLALASWYVDKYSKPLKLSYVGIDDSKSCRDFAERFANRNELFAMQNPPLFESDCSRIDVSGLKKCVTQGGTLLFIFSYVFGQNSCEEKHWKAWALFARDIMIACEAKHNLVAYMNSPPYPDKDNSGQYIDPNTKYAQFCQLLGWRSLPKQGTYQKRLLKRFNEAVTPQVTSKVAQSFRHLIVDATLVDEKGIPIREDRKRP